jgi:hypothetical protein
MGRVGEKGRLGANDGQGVLDTLLGSVHMSWLYVYI